MHIHPLPAIFFMLPTSLTCCWHEPCSKWQEFPLHSFLYFLTNLIWCIELLDSSCPEGTNKWGWLALVANTRKSMRGHNKEDSKNIPIYLCPLWKTHWKERAGITTLPFKLMLLVCPHKEFLPALCHTQTNLNVNKTINPCPSQSLKRTTNATWMCFCQVREAATLCIKRNFRSCCRKWPFLGSSHCIECLRERQRCRERVVRTGKERGHESCSSVEMFCFCERGIVCTYHFLHL